MLSDLKSTKTECDAENKMLLSNDLFDDDNYSVPGTNAMVYATVDSLMFQCTDYVIKNLRLYVDSVKYLPPQIKNIMLSKFTSTSYYWNNVNFKSALKNLVHGGTQHVDLTILQIDDETLDILSGCSKLREFYTMRYVNEGLTSKGLTNFFSGMTNLQSVQLSNCTKVNDDVLLRLVECCPALSSLDLCNCPNVTDTGLTYLAALNNLTCLTLNFTKVTNEGLQILIEGNSKLALKELRLANCRNISASILNVIARNCPKLEVLVFYNLNLSECEVDEFGVPQENFKNLKQLTFSIKW